MNGKLVMYVGVAIMVISASSASLAQPVNHAPAVEKLHHCEGFLEGIVLDGSGMLALDVVAGRVLRITSDGECQEEAKIAGFPSGAKRAPDGTITIVGGSGLYSFDPGKKSVTKLSLQFDGVELTGLNDLSYDRSGGIYITAPNGSDALNRTGRVFYRSPTGTVSLVASGLAFPNGVAVAPDGNYVAVAEFALKRILSIPSVGSKEMVKVNYVLAHTDGGIGPDGMTFDPDGRLFAANFGAGTLTVVPADGKSAYTLHLGGDVGPYVTNMEIKDGQAFLTEAKKGEIWKVDVRPHPQK